MWQPFIFLFCFCFVLTSYKSNKPPRFLVGFKAPSSVPHTQNRLLIIISSYKCIPGKAHMFLTIYYKAFTLPFKR